MIYYVDIDNTITITTNGDYENAIPLYDRIAKINELYDGGHEVVYWTARGTVTKVDYLLMTYNQLLKWKCKFHTLKMWKPHYDVFIDDKNINAEDYFKSLT
jgi:hypothetical protein